VPSCLRGKLAAEDGLRGADMAEPAPKPASPNNRDPAIPPGMRLAAAPLVVATPETLRAPGARNPFPWCLRAFVAEFLLPASDRGA
jgi:hypothetical protein